MWTRVAGLFVVIAGLGLSVPMPSQAHESRPGYLELRELGSGEIDVLWKRPVSGEVELRIAPRFPDGCQLVGATMSEQEGGALLVRGRLACEGGLAGKTIGVDGLESTITDVLVRVFHTDGVEETHLLRPASPSVELGRVEGGLARGTAFVRLGVEHILQGVDHLLFVLGLLLIVGSTRMLVKTITSFTVAHSITLALATLGVASVPPLPLNAVIALSILFLGPEIVRARRGGTSLTIRHPWIVAFLFGLLHGFGFATGLAEMGLPRGEIPFALLAFNVGVEIGQLLFVGLILLLVRSFRTLEIVWPRWAHAFPAYAIGTLGAFWTIQRTVLVLGGIV